VLKNLFDTVVNVMLNPRVVHSLPGRLRIHIPALRRVTDNWQLEEDSVARLVNTLPGIHSVSVSYITGNLLIQYNQDRITEEKLIAWIQKIGRVLLQKRRQLTEISPEKFPVFIRRLDDYLNEKPVQNFQEVTIPDDVFS
jgi:hypothetical protein